MTLLRFLELRRTFCSRQQGGYQRPLGRTIMALAARWTQHAGSQSVAVTAAAASSIPAPVASAPQLVVT